MYKILTLNNISSKGLERLPRDRYETASEIQHPDAVLLRSFKMHDWTIPETLRAVGRAGVGVNNIPIDKMSARGIPVFNAPGANANAVKELVLGCMLLASRNMLPAWDYARNLKGTDAEITKQVEAGKKKFVGFELSGRTLGVIGLGAIGVKVANAAQALGMKVIGYDPKITVKNAWQLQAHVKQALSVEDMLSKVEFLTVHVPFLEATRHLISATRLQNAREGLVIFNFSRDGIVDETALSEAIKAGRVNGYVCDFPNNLLINHEKVINLPHLGASTKEAEENCAIMVADQVRDYLEDGAVHNSVNFPEMEMPRNGGQRLLVVNSNVPGMIECISKSLADANLNILDLLNRSRGDIACTLVDVNNAIPQTVVDDIQSKEGVLTVQTL
ncbi:3-phosphoglycerate dehydrogenase family protein [Candidatus Parabeggiatoa sp. HSG14]|uniref:3-phosphoglycerate dehydrogenase family protein n=1 Tax=Candidatus Parabeggiatoa sp. HSG14 TaxID=3055593 RepID=UPI0025A6AD60|nr:3-phosphoglycerate dehydrogenase family protein [Thiotrichales bacterium HSG14]